MTADCKRADSHWQWRQGPGAASIVQQLLLLLQVQRLRRSIRFDVQCWKTASPDLHEVRTSLQGELTPSAARRSSNMSATSIWQSGI